MPDSELDPDKVRTELQYLLASAGAEGLMQAREQLLAWSKASNPALRGAGRAWSAAFGAMLMIVREADADIPKLLGQIEALSRAGEESWLAFVEEQAKEAMGIGGMSMVGLRASKTVTPSIDPAAANLLQELINTCALGRKALRQNDPALSQEFARRMTAVETRGQELGLIPSEEEEASEDGPPAGP